METVPNTISASRVPALLGIDKRCSPLTLFLRLRGAIGEEDLSENEAVREGIFYERATADIACHKFGMRIVDGFEQKTLTHGQLSGHPDFLAIDEHGKLAILEVKNPFWSYAGDDGDDSWGEPGTDQVPKAHMVQAMIYCHLFREWSNSAERSKPRAVDIFDKELADYAYVIARLRGGVERYKVPLDKEVIRLVEEEVRLMLTRVEIDDPPDPQDEADQRMRWVVKDPTKKAPCNVEMVALLDTLRNVKKQLKAMGEQESAIKAQILGHARDAAVLEYVDHGTGEAIEIATLKPMRKFDKRQCLLDHAEALMAADCLTVDVERLKKHQRALHEQYSNVPEDMGAQTRQLRLKEKAIDQILKSMEGK